MKKFIQNSLLFCLVGFLVLSPYHIRKLFKFPKLKQIQESLNKEPDIILFGSSVNRYRAPNDSDRRTIAEMLDAFIPDQSVTGISHSAYHADIFLEYVKFIIKSGKKPVVIIPINFRSFSPGWDLRPTYQFSKEKFLLQENSFWVNLKYLVKLKYQDDGEQNFNDLPIYYGNEVAGSVKDYEFISTKESDKLSEMRKGFIYHYMQPLTKNHRKIKSLVEIGKLGKKNKIKIIMYITPIDYLYAEQLEIKDFRQRQNANINIVKSSLSSFDIELIDMCMSLDSSYFHYEKRPNEHLNMYGRKEIAKALKMALSR